MPIHRGKNSQGPYFQFGSLGKKYFYIAKNQKSREFAYKQCLKQAHAIKMNKKV